MRWKTEVLSFSILDIPQHSTQSECQSFQFHQSCLFLSFGSMSLFNVYSSYWILPEMSQKSAQPIFAFPQFWWTLCWCLKYESTQPFVLGILSLFSVFCWMQQLAAAEKTCDLWLGLWWSNPECICALPSRSFSYQCSTADWTGLACQAACC